VSRCSSLNGSPPRVIASSRRGFAAGPPHRQIRQVRREFRKLGICEIRVICR
jgi:hypothetical protein